MNQAVIEGKKTMTRRIAKPLNHPNIIDVSGWGVDDKGKVMLSVTYDTVVQEDVYPHFQIGDEVAVAMAYKTIYARLKEIEVCTANDWWLYAYHKIGNGLDPSAIPGYNNKMFVLADLMPYRIRITDIKVERLQDISDEDCLKEGIMEGEFMNTWDKFFFDEWGDVPNHITFKTPRAAFAALIDRISGRGTWNRNLWCFCYEFELVKMGK